MDKIEQEANAFALALLMPEDLLIQEVEKHPSLGQDDIESLAKTFNVGEAHLRARLLGLGFLV